MYIFLSFQPIPSSSQLCLNGIGSQAPAPPVCSSSTQLYSSQTQSWSDNAACSSSQNNTNQQTLAELTLPVNGDHLRALPSTSHGHISHLNLASSSHHQPVYNVMGEGLLTNGLTGTECTICYENHIDSVLYMCGHMCMCYRCAVQQWKGKGGGQCPLCRAPIKDVIRTYKP